MWLFHTRVLFLCGVIIAGFEAQDVAQKPSYCLSTESKTQKPAVAWRCYPQSQKCQRTVVDNATNDVHDTDCLTSLNVCKLICDRYASLWPKPTGVITIQKTLLPINSGGITFDVQTPGDNYELFNLLEALQNYFLDVLGYTSQRKEPFNNGINLKIKFVVKDKNTTVFSNTAFEQYTLSVTTSPKAVEVLAEGDNYLGVRHAVETLLQLIVFDEISESLLIPSGLYITDVPAYKHRGILLDTSRTFFPVKAIKRTLDAMAYNKLNSFHWHITDTHSFPFASKTHPKMAAYGAYSPSQVYTWSDISDIVEYAKVRGIRVVPELNAPAHVGEGWQEFDEDVLLCFKAEPWRNYCVGPPCGILNPVNGKVYEVLRDLYGEFNQLFQSDVFHMGGDEIKFDCWNETESVVQWMDTRNIKRNKANFLNLWGAFQAQALLELDKSVKEKQKPKIILWTSVLTETKEVKQFLDPKRYIIQIWTSGQDKQIADLLNAGYELILSNYDALYFDCGFGAWIGEGNNWCSPYKSWQTVYMNDPKKMVDYLKSTYGIVSPDPQQQILGAEAALWSEQSDQHNLDSRLWPRAAALAERLWSDPQTDWRDAESRFLTQRERLAARNIAPDLVEPLWCHHYEGLCY